MTGNRWRRPWTVTAAVLSLNLTVLTLIAGTADTVDRSIRIHRLLPLAGRNVGASASEVAHEQQLDTVIGLAVAATSLLPALLLAGLAFAVWRGRDVARTVLFPTAGSLALFCGVLAGAGTEDRGKTPLFTEANRLAAAEQPWAAPEVAARTIVILLPLLAVALLVLPPSNRFFRERRAARVEPKSISDASSGS